VAVLLLPNAANAVLWSVAVAVLLLPGPAAALLWLVAVAVLSLPNAAAALLPSVAVAVLLLPVPASASLLLTAVAVLLFPNAAVALLWFVARARLPVPSVASAVLLSRAIATLAPPWPVRGVVVAVVSGFVLVFTGFPLTETATSAPVDVGPAAAIPASGIDSTPAAIRPVSILVNISVGIPIVPSRVLGYASRCWKADCHHDPPHTQHAQVANQDAKYSSLQ